MITIQTILHPTDFSDHSSYAFELACNLACDYHARLVIMHVTPSPTAVGHAQLVPTYALHQDELKRQLRQLTVHDKNVRVAHRFEQGDAVTEILRVAQEENASLIVMGTHGRSALAGLLMGRVAEHVLRRATCPVLTVKSRFIDPAASAEACAN
jgi:nucleotide-binding universal stress UspA family protein